ncbi:hypothetical protein J6590_024173 [Homalodisca vitripennis]|nr:hypothetical protein J6590_024173 [Homalodisca vitripennis]
MSQRKCFRDAAHNATPPPLPPITTHSRSRAQLKSSNCTRHASASAANATLQIKSAWTIVILPVTCTQRPSVLRSPLLYCVAIPTPD